MIRLIIGDDAQADLLTAFSFYEDRLAGLGERFRDHVDFAFSRIQIAPERYPIAHRDVRQRRVERFPYAVFYRVYPGLVLVVAVMHAKRAPALLKRRAK